MVVSFLFFITICFFKENNFEKNGIHVAKKFGKFDIYFAIRRKTIDPPGTFWEELVEFYF